MRNEELFSRLVQYISVTVTEMFRDPQVYRSIRSEVVPMLRTWPHVRVWCAGCATGEELYSLAILFGEEGLYHKTTFYATDLNDASLERARSGVYPLKSFREATRNYQAAGGTASFGEYYHARYDAAVMDSDLRSRVTFANHNLVMDQVFGEMHLIFCRNVMIYFNRELQNRVLKLFTDSLVPGGFLCVGTMESLQFTEAAEQYESVAGAGGVFRRRVDSGVRRKGER